MNVVNVVKLLWACHWEGDVIVLGMGPRWRSGWIELQRYEWIEDPLQTDDMSAQLTGWRQSAASQVIYFTFNNHPLLDWNR